MGRIIDVIIHCKGSNNRYKTYFEEKQPEKWYGVRMERIEPLSFFDKMAVQIRLKQKSNSGSSPFAKLSSGASFSKEGGKANYRGTFYRGDHKCPYCGNTNFVRCGKCREWTCNPVQSNQFACSVCGNTGTISGTIDSASGNLSQNGKQSGFNGNNGKKFI